MRLLCDAMLGRLARDLRLLGHDAALASPDAADDAVALQAREEQRVLLTRDVRLGTQARGAGLPHLVVASTDPAAQLAQAAAALGLSWDEAAFLSRCSVCNVPLEPAPDAPPPDAQGPCVRCPACGRVYWQGAHVRSMRQRLRRALAGDLTGPGSAPAPSPPR